MSDGTVWAWGRNDRASWATARTTNRSTPAPVGGLAGVIAAFAAARSIRRAEVRRDGMDLGRQLRRASWAATEPVATRPSASKASPTWWRSPARPTTPRAAQRRHRVGAGAATTRASWATARRRPLDAGGRARARRASSHRAGTQHSLAIRRRRGVHLGQQLLRPDRRRPAGSPRALPVVPGVTDARRLRPAARPQARAAARRARVGVGRRLLGPARRRAFHPVDIPVQALGPRQRDAGLGGDVLLDRANRRRPRVDVG